MTGNVAPQPAFPQPEWRTRIKRPLRWAKRRLRRVYPQISPWIAAAPVQVSLAGTQDVRIWAEDVAALIQPLPAGLPALVCGLRLTVRSWDPPVQGWSGRLGALPGLKSHHVQLGSHGSEQTIVQVQLVEALPLPTVLDAVLCVLRPSMQVPSLVSPHVAAGGGLPSWLSAVATWQMGDAARPNAPAAVDFGLTHLPVGQPIVLGAADASPRWRQDCGTDQPAGTLTFSGDGGQWSISVRNRVAVAGRCGDALSDKQLKALSRLRSVRFETAPESPSALATTLIQLAMTGVLLDLHHLTDRVEWLLAPELISVLSSALPDSKSRPIEWEIRSVQQRRAALRVHSAAFARVSAAGLTATGHLPAVSVLLVTRRPERIRASLEAMARQTYPNLEIVVGLHGVQAAPDLASGLPVPVKVVDVPVTATLGEALGLATAAASGSLVTKVDDDDLYGPEHIWDLVAAQRYSRATVVGKGAEFVYLEPFDSTVRRFLGSEFYTNVVAGGTMLISRGDLEDAGGWRPMERSVDRGLLDRVIRAGGLIYRTHPFGFIYCRHGNGHTWQTGMDYFTRDPRTRWAGLLSHREFGTA